MLGYRLEKGTNMRAWLCLLVSMLALASGPVLAQSAADDPAALPDGIAATGNRDIAEVWLIEPTTRYDHHVEGTPWEAAGLRLRRADGEVLTLMLDEGHVFEDRRPRLADLDGNGRDEVVVVLSSITEGASLAAYSVVGSSILLKARTPYIGTSHRWLNPAGIADYDGDGQLDVAFVAMPHLAKRLEIWSIGDRGFRQIMFAEDFSNHRNGSPHTGMSASADFDGDGVTDLAIPDGSRQVVRVVGFAGMGRREINRIPLPAPADGDFQLEQTSDGYLLRVPLSDGRVHELNL